MRHLMKGLPHLLISTLVLAACGEQGNGGWRGTVRDSAGVVVVSNTGPGVWADGRGWTVRQELRIGTAADDPQYRFGQIAGMDVDAEGRIYVMDQQARQVRVFDAEGRFQHALGQPGSGPGELSQTAGPVFVAPDGAVLVPDLMQQRIIRYSATGEPEGSSPMPMAEGIPMRWMKSADGTLIQQAVTLALPNRPDIQPRNLVVRRGADGVILDTLLELPLGQSIELGDGEPRLTVFAPEPMWAVAPDGGVVAGLNSEYRLRVHSPDGAVRRIIERAGERTPLSDADREAFRHALRHAWRHAGMPAQALEIVSQSLGFAEHYPAYASLFGGPDGTLWVQRVRTPESVREHGGSLDVQDIGGPAWDVFDNEGRYLGVVRMPGRFTPMLFREDRVYGVLRDEMDVQYVARMALETRS